MAEWYDLLTQEMKEVKEENKIYKKKILNLLKKRFL